jgi:hypothetical protein
MKNAVLFALALAVILTGCDRTSPREIAAPEIRGEPINQRPAAPAASAFSANSKPEKPGVAPGESAYPLVGFDKLASYAFDVTDDLMGPVTNNVEAVAAKSNGQIPESVRALNQRAAAIKDSCFRSRLKAALSPSCSS